MIMRYPSWAFLVAFAAMLCTSPTLAQEPRGQDCLTRAEKNPDLTLAEALQWKQEGGGYPAALCIAFARFHAGDSATAATEFIALAKQRAAQHPKEAAQLYTHAGLAAMHANKNKEAERAYAEALRLEPHDPEIWIDRATQRASVELFWDALGDVNKALKLMPDNTEALRLRGQIWMKLELPQNARQDFEKALDLENAEKSKTP